MYTAACCLHYYPSLYLKPYILPECLKRCGESMQKADSCFRLWQRLHAVWIWQRSVTFFYYHARISWSINISFLFLFFSQQIQRIENWILTKYIPTILKKKVIFWSGWYVCICILMYMYVYTHIYIITYVCMYIYIYLIYSDVRIKVNQ